MEKYITNNINLEKYVIILVVVALILMQNQMCKGKEKIEFPNEYGVFIGIDNLNEKILKNYHIIVIDASYFSKKEIQSLKKEGHIVYSYLNIGSLEKFRNYYKKFQDITLGKYENWEDEKWIDVSQVKWQEYVISVLGKSLVYKGVDGFFVDNTDVFYQYPRKKIYNGLIKILKGLKRYDKDIIINGGDTFVSKLISSKDWYSGLITAINQETVFTVIDFKKKTYKAQDKKVTKYFKEYLNACSKKELQVFLTEYGNNLKLQKKIETYCEKKGYIWYIASSYELNGDK